MKTIILVEDDEAIRDSFELLVDKSKYQLQAYMNGRPILNNEIKDPSLFILDRNISGVSGLNLCHFIKYNEQYKGVPVIMLSATPDITTVAKEIGADAAIEKPFSIAEVKRIIAKYLS